MCPLAGAAPIGLGATNFSNVSLVWPLRGGFLSFNAARSGRLRATACRVYLVATRVPRRTANGAARVLR